MTFSYDQDANALAITLRAGDVARTEQFDTGTLVDVDQNENILTIEVISPARTWPLDEIAERFPIAEEDLQVLRKLFAGGSGRYAFSQPAIEVESGDSRLQLVG